eukprot:479996-Amphidinium_carterae.2
MPEALKHHPVEYKCYRQTAAVVDIGKGQPEPYPRLSYFDELTCTGPAQVAVHRHVYMRHDWKYELETTDQQT